MSKILFPTDFSSPASNAFDYAVSIAKALGAKIDVIHIYNIAFSDVSAIPYDFLQQQINEKMDWVNKQFELFLHDKDKTVIENTKPVYGIFPAIEITDFAANHNYDYIVMGTKGSKNRLEKLLGSITTSVLMKAPCPVIAVPAEAKFSGVKRIAYASTFDPSEEHSVSQLTRFAENLGSEMYFVHVNSTANEASFEKIEKVDDYPVPFTEFSMINNLSVTKGLGDYIENNNIDMLGLFIPRRRLWERIFHQSVTKRMALHSRVPLIVFHE